MSSSSFRFDIQSPPINKVDGTPPTETSVPSAGAASSYSSDQTASPETPAFESEHSHHPHFGVSKKLFQTPPQFQSKWEQVVSGICMPTRQKLPTPSPDSKSETGSDYLDLAVSTRNSLYTHFDERLEDTPKMKNASPPTSAEDDPSVSGPWLAPGCSNASTAKQWSDIMAILHPPMEQAETKIRKLWPARGQPWPEDEEDAATVVTGADPPASSEVYKAQIDKLKREIVALKSILGEDSRKIFGVKSAMAKLRDVNTDYLHQMNVLTSELCTAKKQVEELERELEEQTESKEINLRLREEVDRLSNESRDFTHRKKAHADAMNKLKFENEMFALELVHNSEQITELEKSLEELKQENKELKLAMEAEKKKLLVESLKHKKAMEEKNKETPFDEEVPFDVKSQIEHLTSKLEAVEKERHEMTTSYREELNRKDQELEKVKTMVETVLQKQESSSVSADILALEPEIGNNDEKQDDDSDNTQVYVEDTMDPPTDLKPNAKTAPAATEPITHALPSEPCASQPDKEQPKPAAEKSKPDPATEASCNPFSLCGL